MDSGIEALYWDGRHYDFQNLGYEADLPFYLSLAQSCGGPILELGCGTGRLSIPLAQAGHIVTGMDQAEHMLLTARNKAEQAHVRIRWIRKDIRDFSLQQKFRLILLPFNTLGHLLDRPSLEGCLGMVRDHLARGGIFALDVFRPRLDYLMRPHDQRVPVCQYPSPDGEGLVTIEETGWYDPQSQLFHVTWHVDPGNGQKPYDLPNTMRMYFPQELDAILHYNGLPVVERYGDFDRSSPGPDSPRQVLVCRV